MTASDVDERTAARSAEARDATLAPPGRTGGARPGENTRPGSPRDAVTEVLRRVRAPRPAPSGGTPPTRGGGPRRPGRSRLPAPGPRVPAPRDMRWWAGASILAVSVLLLAFVAHVAVLSSFQHHRAQDIGYDALRTTLAKAETPVGQLDLTGELVPSGTPVALLTIPSLGLSEVVREGTEGAVLRSGPGHRRDSVMPGQAGTSVLFGRQVTYGGPFGPLTRLQPGDDIDVMTGQGAHTYRVIGLRRAGDPLPEDLRSGQGRLELQTADGVALFPSGVLYVDAELVSPVQTTPTRVMSYPALPVPERAMGQDAGAWFIAFFVLVFFAAASVALWWLWRAWGRWHAWLIGVPVLLALGVSCADVVMNALPNLL